MCSEPTVETTDSPAALQTCALGRFRLQLGRLLLWPAVILLDYISLLIFTKDGSFVLFWKYLEISVIYPLSLF